MIDGGVAMACNAGIYKWVVNMLAFEALFALSHNASVDASSRHNASDLGIDQRSFRFPETCEAHRLHLGPRPRPLSSNLSFERTVMEHGCGRGQSSAAQLTC
jgi:hypothetical protein